MRIYRPGWLKHSIVQDLKREASRGVHMGRNDSGYTLACTVIDAGTGSVLIYTRDAGMHTSGWLKNPDYERCLHLSISFRAVTDLEQIAPFDRALAGEWVELFFGPDKRLVLVESPKSPAGRQHDVHHFRVFCDEHWQPILPRKEVYTTDFTELGWRSYSELHPEDPRNEPSVLFAG